MVTSSWVGPTPPEVNTTSKLRLNARTSAAIRSHLVRDDRDAPHFHPERAQLAAEVGGVGVAILPERISLPMSMIPAVFAMAGGTS